MTVSSTFRGDWSLVTLRFFDIASAINLTIFSGSNSRMVNLGQAWEISPSERVGPLLGNSGPPRCNLIQVFTILFSGTLLSESLLHSASFARLQVEGVALDLLDNVFLLHLALEAA